MKNFTHKFIGLLALVFTMSFTVNAQGPPPPPGNPDAGCMDVDALNYNPNAIIEPGGSCEYSEAYILQAAFDEGAASVDITSDNQTAFDAGVASVATQNIPLDLPQGWSMFGYTCPDSVDAMVGFSDISDKIEIVKDEWGLSYLPSWEFNAMGSLQFSEGYQIKMIEGVDGFQFCSTITPEDGIGQADVDTAYDEGAASVDITSDNQAAFDEGAASVTPEDGITQADVDEAVAEVEASYEGWCESDLDNDGICDVDEVWGCMETEACNWVLEAEFDDGGCVYTQEGYDCDGNLLLQIGGLHAGGIVFYIDESGEHGLVAAMEDLEGVYEWGCIGTSISGADGQAIGTGYQNTLDIAFGLLAGCSETPIAASEALAYVSEEGYSGWVLPSKYELLEMYNTIGNGGPQGNIGGFSNDWYWSSSEANNYYAWNVNFPDGYSYYNGKNFSYRVRVIRPF